MRTVLVLAFLLATTALAVPVANASWPNPCVTYGDGVGVTRDYSYNEYVFVCSGGHLLVRQTLPYGGHPCDNDPRCTVPMFFVPFP